MHELSVTENLLSIALRHAREAGAGRVTDLYVVIGDLSSIVDDSVQFYWDIVAEGSLAEGARLHFRRVPIEVMCVDCRHRYSPARDDLACPACGSARIRIAAGEEFSLEAIDVEEAAPVP